MKSLFTPSRCSSFFGHVTADYSESLPLHLKRLLLGLGFALGHEILCPFGLILSLLSQKFFLKGNSFGFKMLFINLIFFEFFGFGLVK